MNALLPLLATLAQIAPQPSAVPVVPMPRGDWAALPELAFIRRWPNLPELSAYVRDEARAGRCAVTGRTITVDLAVMVAANGQLRRIVPRAIRCPTVEQYASGLVSRMARGNVAAPGADTWFRTVLTFAWSE